MSAPPDAAARASPHKRQGALTSLLLSVYLCRVSPDVLIVSLLDGHVVALDQATGRTLWSFDSGAPLVSAKQSFASSQGLNVFPGTDGGLYAYHGITHLNPGLEVRQGDTGCCHKRQQSSAAASVACSRVTPAP